MPSEPKRDGAIIAIAFVLLLFAGYVGAYFCLSVLVEDATVSMQIGKSDSSSQR